METKLAIHITSHTLVGIGGKDFPLNSGNCFGVATTDECHYSIVNFALENLEEAVKRGITWPIKIKILDKRTAIIHDSRIPDNWYSDNFCEICCPRTLLPFPQITKRERQISRGEVQEVAGGVMYFHDKKPVLKPNPAGDLI